MEARANLTLTAICSSLRLLEDELHNKAIPFDDTARRVASLVEAAGYAILDLCQKVPDACLSHMAKARHAVHLRDLRLARKHVLAAIDHAQAAASLTAAP